MEFPGGGRSLERKNLGWVGFKLEKPSVGGMDIFWNHTMPIQSLDDVKKVVAAIHSGLFLGNANQPLRASEKASQPLAC